MDRIARRTSSRSPSARPLSPDPRSSLAAPRSEGNRLAGGIEASGSTDSPLAVLLEASAAWRCRIESALAPVGVGPIEYLVLSRIAEARGRVALASLESEGRALRKDVPQAVARLERKGLVARVSRAAGNDAPGLQLTPSGRTTHKDAAAAVDAVSAEFEAILPAEDRETLGQIAELIASV